MNWTGKDPQQKRELLQKVKKQVLSLWRVVGQRVQCWKQPQSHQMMLAMALEVMPRMPVDLQTLQYLKAAEPLVGCLWDLELAYQKDLWQHCHCQASAFDPLPPQTLCPLNLKEIRLFHHMNSSFAHIGVTRQCRADEFH